MRLSSCVRFAAPIGAAMVAAGCGGGNSTPTAVSGPPVVVSQANKALLIQVPDKDTLKTAGVTTSAGQAIAIKRNANGGIVSATVSGKLKNGATAPGTGPLTGATPQPLPDGSTVSANSGPDALIVDVAQANSSYGLLVLGSTSVPEFFAGGYHTGTETSLSSMPKNVTAKYVGGFVGLMAIELSNNSAQSGAGIVTGDSTINADFASGRVDGRVANMADRTGTASPVDVTLNGTIKGAGYTGNANIVSAGTDTVVGTTQSSALNGSFYGPAAAETAAAVSVVTRLPADAANPGGGSIYIAGGLGGKKTP
jgi:C-lobe and N-lobe beta barrels of Tf-binding protein B